MTSLNLSNTFQHLRRDALAGTVAGAMAVPLTAGICLMSDYPIMTGMYTVIFACIVGFITYLFKPGNYVGTPASPPASPPPSPWGSRRLGTKTCPSSSS